HPGRISRSAPGSHEHGTGAIRQTGTRRQNPPPLSPRRLSHLFRAPRIGRGGASHPQPQHGQGFLVPLQPAVGRGRGPAANPEILGIDRGGPLRFGKELKSWRGAATDEPARSTPKTSRSSTKNPG